MIKKIYSLIIFSFIILTMYGCSLRKKIYDDFTSGISKDRWVIINKAWGKENGGVVPQNVLYTKDKLILRANGDYYTGDIRGYKDRQNTRVGGAICTKDSLGPGEYSVRAKILPRFGACCAFWTYAFIGKEINSEIDIELGINNDFSNIMFTNWLTEKNYESKKLVIDKYLNDGKFHTYKFKWYTYPTKKIEYYIDEICYYTSYNKIPMHKANFWIGVWFPYKWAGEPNFDTDFMEIDYFKYEEYTSPNIINNPNEISCPDEYYPTKESLLPNRNLISNPNFKSNIGWNINNNEIKNNTLILTNNQKATQKIEYIYPRNKYILNLDAKGSNINIKFNCFDKNNKFIETLNHDEILHKYYKNIKKEIILNNMTDTFEISFSSTNATVKNISLDFSN